MNKSNKREWSMDNLNDLCNQLNTTKKGLSSAEAKKRLKKYGKNIVKKQKGITLFTIILNQLKSPISYMLFFASIVLLILGERIDAGLIFVVFFINIVIGTTQEERSSKAFEKINKIRKHKAIVYRDGKLEPIESQYIVPGDIIFLREGLLVLADLRLISEDDIKVNESTLTGEWLPVSKHQITLSGEKSVSEQVNMIWSGTSVVRGEGFGCVVETGESTQIGMISKKLSSIVGVAPLTKDIKRVLKLVISLIVVNLVIIFIFGILENKYELYDLLLTSTAIAVGAIPSGLPAAITLVLALGMQNVFKKGGLVRNLFAAETLGTTTWILSDKTGTVTKGEMSFSKLFNEKEVYTKKDFNNPHMKNILFALLMGTSSKMICAKGGLGNRMFGEPIEHAIAQAIIDAKIDVNVYCDNELMKTDFIPFSSKRKFSAGIIHDDESDEKKMYIVGDPDTVISMCNSKATSSSTEKLTQEKIKEIKEKIALETRNGARVVAVASAVVKQDKFDPKEKEESVTKISKDITFLAVMSFEDSIRSNIKESISKIRKSNIRFSLVTGDNKETAGYIGRKIGIIDKDSHRVIDGNEFSKMSTDEIYSAAMYTPVFAKMLPNQKLRLIRILQNHGEIVAMTGDGVNDATALEQASVGLSLSDATEVSKESSDIILLENSFDTINAAVLEGRRIIINLKKIIIYLLSTAFSEAIVITGAIIAGFALPLIPAQILWANIIEEAFVGFGFAFEKSKESSSSGNPKSSVYSSIVSKNVSKSILILAVSSGLFLFAILVFLNLFTNASEAEIRTIIFTALSLDSIFFAFSLKNLYGPIKFKNIFDNKELIIAICISLGFLCLALFYVPVRTFLQMTTFPLWFVGMLPVLAILHLLLIEGVKKVFLYKEAKQIDV